MTHQTHDTLADERLAFEKAMSENQYRDFKFYESANMYQNMFTQAAWLGWQFSAARALPAAGDQAGGWQDIETAPKDAKDVWLMVGNAVVRGTWCEQEFREHRDSDGNYLSQQDADAFWMNLETGDTCEPTHWQPIVKPAVTVGALTVAEIDALIAATADPEARGTMTQRLHRLARAVEARTAPSPIADAAAPAGMVEANEGKLWCVNVHGPDDVYAMPNKAAALERANELNIYFAKLLDESKTPEHDPIMRAVVIEWPHSAESHAADLAAQSSQRGE